MHYYYFVCVSMVYTPSWHKLSFFKKNSEENGRPNYFLAFFNLEVILV